MTQIILIKLHNSVWNVLMPNIALGYCKRTIDREQIGKWFSVTSFGHGQLDLKHINSTSNIWIRKHASKYLEANKSNMILNLRKMKNDRDNNWITIIAPNLVCYTKSTVFIYTWYYISEYDGITYSGHDASAHDPMNTSSISEWSDHGIAESGRACPTPVYAAAHTIIAVFCTQF